MPPKPVLNLGPTEPPAMIALKLRCPSQAPLFSEEQWRTIADRLELSRCEVQIAKLFFENAQEQSIAGELGISVNTVHTHVKRLYLKVGVRSRLELVVQIVRAPWPTCAKLITPGRPCGCTPVLEKPPDAPRAMCFFAGSSTFPAAFTTSLGETPRRLSPTQVTTQ